MNTQLVSIKNIKDRAMYAEFLPEKVQKTLEVMGVDSSKRHDHLSAMLQLRMLATGSRHTNLLANKETLDELGIAYEQKGDIIRIPNGYSTELIKHIDKIVTILSNPALLNTIAQDLAKKGKAMPEHSQEPAYS